MSHLADYLTRNNIIYKHPPLNWWQGWLIGNGHSAATLWNPDDKLCFQLGHTDAIDLTPHIPEEGSHIPNMRHTLRGGITHDGLPLFDPMYLKEYEAYTELATGIVSLQASSQFGTFKMESFYVHTPDIFVFEFSDTTLTPTTRTLNLERLGSRILPRIWTQVTTDSSYGLGKTSITQKGEFLIFQHTQGEFNVAAAVHILDSLPYEDAIHNFYLNRCYIPSTSFNLQLKVAVGLGHTLEECTQNAIYHLNQAYQLSLLDLKALKTNEMAKEWPDSYIDLPKDPYWENLWYSSRYHLRTCYKGHYPAFFINGPFSGMRDKREWAECWLHWNMHASHLCIPSTGDWDLFEAYIHWRMRQIEPGKHLARTLFDADGFVTQDQQKPTGGNRGLNEEYFTLQLVSNLQTSLHFYTYWKFTKDQTFLLDYLAPYLLGTLTFWKSYLVKEDDRYYHIPRSHPYEFHGGYAFKDCLTDLSHLKKCLSIFEEILPFIPSPEENLTTWCLDASSHLVPFTEVSLPEEYVTCSDSQGHRFYDNPFFYGQPYQSSDKVFSMGLSEKTHTYVSHSDTHAERLSNPNSYGVFCSSQSAFIYPCKLIDSNASPEWRELTHSTPSNIHMWENARNALRTIRRYPKQLKEFPAFSDSTLDWTGHSLELPAFAVLGLANELRHALDYYIDTFQMFPQGLFNYHPRVKWLYGYSHPRSDSSEPLRVDHNPYSIHLAFEPTNIFTETLTLSLLDSSNGLIKLFQAYTQDAHFLLPASDGFWVEATQLEGEIKWIRIRSTLGGPCQIRLHWPNAFIKQESDLTCLTLQNSILAFDTLAGKDYLITSQEFILPTTPSSNSSNIVKPREFQSATIGLFKRF